MHSCKEVIAKRSVRQLQEGQHYQLVDNAGCTTNYSCSFTWKIDQVQQKGCLLSYLNHSTQLLQMAQAIRCASYCSWMVMEVDRELISPSMLH